MLGYVTPEKPELKIKEYEIYSGYYCGICKSIGKRYGQLPRLVLNYDLVLLALVLAGVNPAPDEIKIERCIVHPLKKRTIIHNSKEIDYAADILLLLAYFNLKDDYQDDRDVKSALGIRLFKNVFKRLTERIYEKTNIVNVKLEELSILEQKSCPSLDAAAEPFAKLMEEVFDPLNSCLDHENYSEKTISSFRRIGYHLGKWIYLIDAYDDLEDDMKSRSYNPLIYQFNLHDDLIGPEKMEEITIRIRERVEFNLMCYLAEIAKSTEDLHFEKNQGLIDNIIYLGLLRKTEQITKKGNNDNEKSL
ncbi:MAG: DUF5685 family protein [Anaerovoracaceae bacterium]|jgi:hypothetical protein